jgi:hypothetical protein
MLIFDKDEETAANQIFTDEEIAAFLALESEPILAAADALDAMANGQALILKVIKLLDLQTDGARLADALRAGAEKLRDRYFRQSQGLEFVEIVTTPSSLWDRLEAEWMREL